MITADLSRTFYVLDFLHTHPHRISQNGLLRCKQEDPGVTLEGGEAQSWGYLFTVIYYRGGRSVAKAGSEPMGLLA